MKWKNADWCFYEYKLAQIRVVDGKVREAKDGSFCTSGQDLADSCRPLTLRNASLSDHARYWSDRLHKEGHNGLNYPDIHRKLVELWCDACDAPEGEKQGKASDAIGEFAQQVLRALDESPEIQGVPLLRRKYG
jgi:hypothetical protein